ncbi:MAG: hypothetical protein Q7R52_01995 [archaeon]|nr:hypothetical protein [archaeon]
MEKIPHPLKYSTFLIILFGIVGFFGSYASAFVWNLLNGNPWQIYLGWISLVVILLLVFLIWATSSLIALIIGKHKFRE